MQLMSNGFVNLISWIIITPIIVLTSLHFGVQFHHDQFHDWLLFITILDKKLEQFSLPTYLPTYYAHNSNTTLINIAPKMEG